MFGPKEFLKFLASLHQQLTQSPPPSPAALTRQHLEGGCKCTSQYHLIRSLHLVAPPDKSSPYPLQSKLTGMRARNSEHARFWLLDWCVCGYSDPPSHTRWIHTLEQPIPTWEMPAQSIHRSGPINHKSSLKLNWSKISYISSEL